MKKAVLFLVFCLMCVSGCSPTKPEITWASFTDANPVSGQRILLRVSCTTDNPPLMYLWSASGGTLEDGGLSQYWAYWTAPETTGDYTISCRVIDDEGENETFPFSVRVSARADAVSLLEDGEVALCTARRERLKAGGIWAAVAGEYLHSFSATASSTAGWGEDFNTMVVSSFTNYYYTTSYAFKGVLADSAEIITYSSSTEDTLDCDTCEAGDVISTMHLDGSYLWVGSGSGLHGYASSDWMDRQLDDAVFDIYSDTDLTLVATTAGIYTWDKETDSSPAWTAPEGALADPACAVVLDSQGNIWSVNSALNEVRINGIACAAQPDVVVCSLDVDLLERIWCGTYCTTDGGETWTNPTGIDDSTDQIVASQVSPEGLLYLRSVSGRLYVWGKAP